MKTLPHLLSLVALTFVLPIAIAAQAPRTVPDTTLLAPPIAPGLKGEADKIITAVRAADDQRISASLTADRRKLIAVYSDALRYQHSNGAVDDKEALIGKIMSGRTAYKSMRYKDRTFTVAAPEIVLMRGRVHFVAVSGGQELDTDLSFLAVWRLEGGTWRFLAWQSARIPPPAAK